MQINTKYGDISIDDLAFLYALNKTKLHKELGINKKYIYDWHTNKSDFLNFNKEEIDKFVYFILPIMIDINPYILSSFNSSVVKDI